MADADAVRAALRYDKVNIVGGSYGTRAALEYLRQFPQQVRRAQKLTQRRPFCLRRNNFQKTRRSRQIGK
jgi:homoserine acetyltransferase